jgi:outer membrane protein OmpA-like peptidoglycan-associated protein
MFFASWPGSTEVHRAYRAGGRDAAFTRDARVISVRHGDCALVPTFASREQIGSEDAMLNIVEAIESRITPEHVARVSESTGVSTGVTRRAMSVGAIGIVAGLVRRFGSAGGAANLLSSLRSGHNAGGALLGDQTEHTTDAIARSSGVSRVAATGVLGALLPIAGGVISHEVTSHNLDATQLSTLMRSQRSFLPANVLEETERDVSVSNAPRQRVVHAAKAGGPMRGLGWLLAALGILLLLGLLIFSMRKPEAPRVSGIETPTINAPKAPSMNLPEGPKIGTADLPKATAPDIPAPGPAPAPDMNAQPPEEQKADEQKSEAATAGAPMMGTDDIAQHFSGTTVPDKLALSGVRFDFDSSTIKDGSDATLDALAAQMKEHPSVNLRLDGYTDSTGDQDVNKPLSYQRALAVKKALTDRGVDENRIDVMGKRDLNAVESNSTAEGRAANRRVEAVITKR